MKKLVVTFIAVVFGACNLAHAASAGTVESQLPRTDMKKIVATAKKYQGVPYVYGGMTPKGFDCSGYVQYVFAQNKVKLPRTADDQYIKGQPVCDKQLDYRALKPGDLLFFATETPKNTGSKTNTTAKTSAGAKTNKTNITSIASTVSHVGIYLGDKKFIDAESTKGVTISATDDIYWRSRFVGARRVAVDSEQTRSFWEYILALFE